MRSTLACILVVLVGIGCVHTPENITLDTPPASEAFDGKGMAEIVVVRPSAFAFAVVFGVFPKLLAVIGHNYDHCVIKFAGAT